VSIGRYISQFGQVLLVGLYRSNLFLFDFNPACVLASLLMEI
jgi:hypothetical protein